MKNAFNMATTGKHVAGPRGPIVYNDDELTCLATHIEQHWFFIVCSAEEERTNASATVFKRRT